MARSRWHDVEGLIDNVARTGRRLVEAQPKQLVIANIVRRVLGLIRDEAAEDRNEAASETLSEAQMTPTDTVVPPAARWSAPTPQAKPDSIEFVPTLTRQSTSRPGMVSSYSSVNVPKSLFHLLSVSGPNDADPNVIGSPFGTSGASTPSRKVNMAEIHSLRSEVIDGIEEIQDEISQVDDQIATLAEVQVHPGDYVLVHEPSRTVEKFITRAANKRKFTVLIATEPPRRREPEEHHASFKKKLAALGTTVINIENGSLMAYMSRVDKVVIGALAVVANGGVVADAGAAAVARAAKEQGNPVIVLSGMYKLSPESPFHEEAVIEWGASSTYVGFDDGAMVSNVDVRNALTELVPAQLVDTYVTNL